MSVHNAIITACHDFTAEDHDNGRLPFEPASYARLKYGDDSIAKQFGYELADHFFEQHHISLIIQQCVVIPSPYNFVENAATIMTRHFVNRLNHLIVQSTGIHVDYATIQRKLSYSADYGNANADQRRELISNDKFYIHQEFFKDKTMIFVDDVRITGAHEERLVQLIDECSCLNDSHVHFVYYGRLVGDQTRNDIEAYLNNASMSVDRFVDMQNDRNNHLIVRPIKWLMRMHPLEFERYLAMSSSRNITNLYYACLGEGYYSVPDYQSNFNTLKNMVSCSYT